MTTHPTPRPALCPNCRVAGTGQFCSECGAAYADGSANPYVFLADSFFEFGTMKQYLLFFGKLIRSPTRNTIEAFEAGRLVDGVRFLKYSLGLYAIGTTVAGLDKIFSDNEVGKVIGQSLQVFVLYMVTYSLYYFALRRKATIQRTRHQYILFACLTTGFTLLTFMLGFVPLVGGIIQLILIVPLYVYLVRVWRYFWGVSGKRVFWTLMACNCGGAVAGFIVMLLIWNVFGMPDFESTLAG
jgi:hypothetical protein